MAKEQKDKQKTPRYVYFQIKPFKDNERGISHREKVVENLISLKDKVISFAVSGNCHGVKFYVKLPTSFKHYFENTFYANYPTSDLAQISSPKFPKERKRVALEKESTYK